MGRKHLTVRSLPPIPKKEKDQMNYTPKRKKKTYSHFQKDLAFEILKARKEGKTFKEIARDETINKNSVSYQRLHALYWQLMEKIYGGTVHVNE